MDIEVKIKLFVVCLIQWMERKKDCPQCRQKCTEKSIFRIYFNTTNLESSINSANLIQKVDDLTLQVRGQDIKIKKLEDEKRKLEDNVEIKEYEIIFLVYISKM